MKSNNPFVRHLGMSTLGLILAFAWNEFRNPMVWNNGWIFLGLFIWFMTSLAGTVIQKEND